MIIDFHNHIFPEIVREKAIKNMEEGYNLANFQDGSVDTLLEIDRQAGITTAVVLGVATCPRQVTDVNNYIIKEVKAHQELVGFGSVHPNYDKNIEEIERITAEGLKGIKLHPDMQEFMLDAEEMDEVYRYLSEKKIPLIIHCGDISRDNDSPERVAAFLDKYPNITLIAAHFGGWLLFDRAYDALKDKKCYVDCSSSQMFLGDRHTRELIRMYGADRVVYGSDFPVWNPVKCLEKFYGLELTEEENRKILYQNAAEILHM